MVSVGPAAAERHPPSGPPMYSAQSYVPSLQVPSVRENPHGFGSDALLCDVCALCLDQQSTSPTGAISVPKDDISQGMNEAQMPFRVLTHIERDKVALKVS